MSRSGKIAVAFLTVCLAWGASFFSIRVGLRSVPPFLLGGVRYGIAGLLMWVWCDARGYERPSARQWAVAAALGICFVVVGNGTVLWAEQAVPSGITALLVAVTPVGTLLLEWAMRQRGRPSGLTWLGLALGLLGVGLLVGRSGHSSFPVFPVVVVLIGTLGWSLGTNLSVRLERPVSSIRAIASQMLVGSFVLLALSSATQEGSRFDYQAVTVATLGALLYLIFVASIAAYIAYGYLVHQVSPTAAGACSYVNPMIAMLLGACFGEPIGVREFLSLAIVLTGVALVSAQELRRTGSFAPSPNRQIEVVVEDRQEVCA